MANEESKSLRPRLERAQEVLHSALQEACGADLDDADTGELIRLEEVLAIANEAAKQAVSVRRRLGREREAGGDPSMGGAHREIEDDRGVRWIIFAVFPSTATTERSPLREPFTKGWLAFDSGLETRRLAPVPGNWTGMTNIQLLDLLASAEIAPRRKPRGQTPPAT